jgi:Mg-chelatase subunit ChlD
MKRAICNSILCAAIISVLCASAFAQNSAKPQPAKPDATATKSAPEKKAPINWSLIDGDRNAEYAHSKLFGLEARGTKFVYVFDRSGSMSEYHGRPLRAAKEELITSLADLDERNQFYVIFYNEEPRLFQVGPVKGRLVFATPDNKQAANDFISGIQADGGTDHMAALEIALRLRPDVIFLLTDGDEASDPTPDEIRRIERTNGGGASINVIQFAPQPRANSTLVELAKQNRGQHLFVDLNKLGERVPASK